MLRQQRADGHPVHSTPMRQCEPKDVQLASPHAHLDLPARVGYNRVAECPSLINRVNSDEGDPPFGFVKVVRPEAPNQTGVLPHAVHQVRHGLALSRTHRVVPDPGTCYREHQSSLVPHDLTTRPPVVDVSAVQASDH
ncbi:MAG TPA: hypothetical protein VIG79_07920, partial [Lapillicoccus sp.]|uniref:hypothetical protein n=1 Tax=Lapillicoccus sp. TaxID=1909287 RepID=UPI002F92D424